METRVIEFNGIKYTIEKDISKLNQGDLFYEEDKGIFEFVQYSNFQGYGTNFPVGVILSENYRHNPFMCRKVIR